MALTPLVLGDVPQQPMISAEIYQPDQLIAGDLKTVTSTIVVLTGASKFVRGSVLGQITASGKYTLALSASGDGSQNPAAILADDCDPTVADVRAGIYQTGEFNGNALTLGTGITLAAATAALAAKVIFIKNAVSAADPT
jgi:hypothetical protein